MFPGDSHSDKGSHETPREQHEVVGTEHRVRFYLGSSDHDMRTSDCSGTEEEIDRIGQSKERNGTVQTGFDDRGKEVKATARNSSGTHGAFKISSLKELFRGSKKSRRKSVESDCVSHDLSGQNSELSLSDLEKYSVGSPDLRNSSRGPCVGGFLVTDSTSAVRGSMPSASVNANRKQRLHQASCPSRISSVSSSRKLSETDRSVLTSDNHHLLSRVLHMGHVIGRGLRRTNSTKHPGKKRGCDSHVTAKDRRENMKDESHVSLHYDGNDDLDTDEEEFYPHSFADESCLRRGDSFMRRHFPHLYKRHSHKTAFSDSSSIRNSKHSGSNHHLHHHNHHQHYHNPHHHHSLREYVLEVLHIPHRLRRTRRGFSQMNFR